MTDILERVGELRAARKSFVLATVVASYPPQSVRSGAKAIVFADGTIEGWIGGGCIRPVIVDEARETLAAAEPRLVRMNAGSGREAKRGIREHPMTCQGEGGVEIYLEPMIPASRLCVMGETPVARALVSLAGTIGYEVVTAPNDAEAVVVATMGVGDEEALAAAAASGASYVGLVASRKKAGFLFDYARATGVADEQLARVKAPAGLDLGGMAPGEIALSILAEIVQRRHCHPERSEGFGRSAPKSLSDMESRALLARAPAPPPTRLGPSVASPPQDDNDAVDPICGMAVDKGTAKHTLEIDGETFYFCCPHCKARFAKARA